MNGTDMLVAALPFLAGLEAWLLPHLVLVAAGLVIAFLPFHALRAALSIAAPLLALFLVWEYAPRPAILSLMGFELDLMYYDDLSRPFGVVFCFAATLAAIYAASVRSRLQQAATLLYAGAAVGAVFAGDLVTLFVWWEATALTSVFLIWARGTPDAYAAGMRYLGWQVASGVALFAGVAIHYMASGSTAVGALALGDFTDAPGPWIILFAVAIKAAFPLVGGWLADAYPSATITGTVTMSIFTTKMAIYTLARGYAGTDFLIAIGAVMAVYPIVLALLSDDLRRTLAYALNSQLGLMVIGVGIGKDEAVAGAVAHAICSVLYQGLLFMAVGAVMMRNGTARVSDFTPMRNGSARVSDYVPAANGRSIARAMPWTFALLLVGAASIASVPGFSGFVSKAITLDQAAKAGLTWAWLAMLAGTVGAILHTALKIPLMLATHEDAGTGRVPVGMYVAMGLAAAACIVIGLFPQQTLYPLAPYSLDYAAYTVSHLIAQVQLLAFVGFAALVVLAVGLWPRPRRSQLIDTDWLYRGFLWPVAGFAGQVIGVAYGEGARGVDWLRDRAMRALARVYGPDSHAARVLATGNMALWIAALLGAALFANLLDIR